MTKLLIVPLDQTKDKTAHIHNMGGGGGGV